MKGLFRTGTLIVGAAIALAAAPAIASAATSLNCSTQTLSQAFSPWNDLNWYTPLGGEAADSVSGTGWTLSGGATLVTTTLQDGRTGQVLNLPAGATAVSPPICISAAYPTARTMVRELNGSAGVRVNMAYAALGVWGPQEAAGAAGSGISWGPSGRLPLPVKILPGTVPARFTLTGTGSRGSAQVYDFLVDPRLSN
jgi:hypothetical protein